MLTSDFTEITRFMPTYEYVCDTCGYEFERFQRISEPPAKRCPKCRAGVRRKIGTGAGLLFKGSGFYITDYRSESYRKAAKAESGGSSSSGSDSAPAKKEPTGKHSAKQSAGTAG
jgi:putative FmdB family regulatory protein